MSYFIMNFINKLKNILLVKNYVKKEKKSTLAFYAKLMLIVLNRDLQTYVWWQ